MGILNKVRAQSGAHKEPWSQENCRAKLTKLIDEATRSEDPEKTIKAFWAKAAEYLTGPDPEYRAACFERLNDEWDKLVAEGALKRIMEPKAVQDDDNQIDW